MKLLSFGFYMTEAHSTRGKWPQQGDHMHLWAQKHEFPLSEFPRMQYLKRCLKSFCHLHFVRYWHPMKGHTPNPDAADTWAFSKPRELVVQLAPLSTGFLFKWALQQGPCSSSSYRDLLLELSLLSGPPWMYISSMYPVLGLDSNFFVLHTTLWFVVLWD